jgi:arylsulfatase A-like enzyme
VPAIVRWPGVTRAGRVCDVPIIGIDFYPTILEMADAPKPAGYPLDGETLVPLLAEKADLKRDAIFWHFPAYLEPYNDRQWPWRITPAGAVRQGDWKLIEFFEDGRLELYNVRDDIGETTNLADKEPERTKMLHAKLLGWRQRVKAPVPTQLNPQFDPVALKRS